MVELLSVQGQNGGLETQWVEHEKISLEEAGGADTRHSSSLFPQDQSLHLTLPVFSSGTNLQTHLCDISKMRAGRFSLRWWLEG